MTRARFLAEQRAMLAQWRDWCARERDAAILWDAAAATYEVMRQILETRHSAKAPQEPRA